MTLSQNIKRRNRRQDKRLRVLKKMAAMRDAKERKRLASWPPEFPVRGQVVRYPFLSWAMRDELSGETHWMPLISVRDAVRRIGMVARFYKPIQITKP